MKTYDPIREGDRIRATRDSKRYSGNPIPKGTVLTFTGLSSMIDGDGFDWCARPVDQGAGSRFLVNPADFELVPEGPKWSDVEAFDKVTFRIRHLDPVGDETRTAYDVDGTPNVLGVSTRSLVIEEMWELLSIEKPKPQPPTTPGSHVTVPFPYWGVRGHLFLLDSGKWASQTGLAFWPTEDVASKDFTVIHDAGAQS